MSNKLTQITNAARIELVCNELTDILETEPDKYMVAAVEKALFKISNFYKPEYGDTRICECGHPYHRHFDSYEDMDPIGCKYCGCYDFQPAKE